jgi:glycosyltransferase involved in cell wall biosynthesis
MSKRARMIAMVQLPPPMHGAAQMNRHTITALAKEVDLQVIEMRFAQELSDITRPTLRKVLIALVLALRLGFALPRCQGLYISFAPCGAAYYRDCFYVLLAKLFRVPSILHLHGRGLPVMRRSPLLRWFQKRVFARQTVILLGETLRREIGGLDCTAVIIANCLDEDAFAKPIAADWRPATPLRILWLSNLFRAKGIETLLAACQQLSEKEIAFDLSIAGAEGDVSKAELETLLRTYGVENATRYIGAVRADDRRNLFDQSDLFVFPSSYANEAQPLVVLEAMASGVPVITSHIATLPEFVTPDQTGWLCPPGAPETLAQTIIEAIRNPEHTNQLRHQARTICEKRFNHARFTDEITKAVPAALGLPSSQKRQGAPQCTPHELEGPK